MKWFLVFLGFLVVGCSVSPLSVEDKNTEGDYTVTITCTKEKAKINVRLADSSALGSSVLVELEGVGEKSAKIYIGDHLIISTIDIEGESYVSRSRNYYVSERIGNIYFKY